MAEITLITGGTRSGKSSFALELAESFSQERRFFIATCPVVDSEMGARVARHQQERLGRGWQTFEEERFLTKVIAEELPDSPGVVLLDCLTLWINNIFYHTEKSGKYISDKDITSLCSEVIAAMKSSPHIFVVVSNEVGLGIVPDNSLARKYRDLVGTANQCFGQKSERVVLVSCGIPLYLKGGAVNTACPKGEDYAA